MTAGLCPRRARRRRGHRLLRVGGRRMQCVSIRADHSWVHRLGQTAERQGMNACPPQHIGLTGCGAGQGASCRCDAGRRAPYGDVSSSCAHGRERPCVLLGAATGAEGEQVGVRRRGALWLGGLHRCGTHKQGPSRPSMQLLTAVQGAPCAGASADACAMAEPRCSAESRVGALGTGTNRVSVLAARATAPPGRVAVADTVWRCPGARPRKVPHGLRGHSSRLQAEAPPVAGQMVTVYLAGVPVVVAARTTSAAAWAVSRASRTRKELRTGVGWGGVGWNANSLPASGAARVRASSCTRVP